jgi:small ligand-binding sensory domain FIST
VRPDHHRRSGHIIETIAQRPAYQVLVDTCAPCRRSAAAGERNLLVGLAMDERRGEFRRGDFIRNLTGIDHERGSLAVGALPRVGQTLQFQLRDPDAADEDLREYRSERGNSARQPVGRCCACNVGGRPVRDTRP